MTATASAMWLKCFTATLVSSVRAFGLREGLQVALLWGRRGVELRREAADLDAYWRVRALFPDRVEVERRVLENALAAVIDRMGAVPITQGDDYMNRYIALGVLGQEIQEALEPSCPVSMIGQNGRIA